MLNMLKLGNPKIPSPKKFAATDVYNINVVHNKAPEASLVLRAAGSSQPSARFALFLLLLLLSKSANQHPSPSSPVLPPSSLLRGAYVSASNTHGLARNAPLALLAARRAPQVKRCASAPPTRRQ